MDPRICIVGAGRLSSGRIYPYIGAAGAQLVGVCDLDEEKATRNARRFGGRVYSDLDKMIAAEKPDGVIVCVGPHLHGPLARQVMRHGIPVYTEKPPAMTAPDALETARVSRQTGVICTTAFKKRYSNAYSRARQWIDTFDPADRYSISFDYAAAQYENTDEKSSFLLDFTVHILDLSLYLFGDVAKVFAFARGRDAYAVSLQYTSGAVGSINLTDGRSFTIPTEEVEITLRGGNFMTVHNSSCWRITENNKPCEWREPPTFTSQGDSGNETGHLAEIVDFLRAIREKRSTRSDISESYKTMLLYEAIRDSAASGQVVEIKPEEI